MLTITATQEIPVQGTRQVLFTIAAGGQATLQVKNSADVWVDSDIVSASGVYTLYLGVPIKVVITGDVRMDVL